LIVNAPPNLKIASMFSLNYQKLSMSPNDKNNLNKKNDGPWQIKKIAVGLHLFFLKKKKKIYLQAVWRRRGVVLGPENVC